MLRRVMFVMMAMVVWSAAGETAKAPIASSPKVELRGKIEKVRITPGAGTPSLDIVTAEGSKQVTLGAMHYLMERNFQPKAGDEVIVKGYLMDGRVVAISVELPATKTILNLRDENGYPLWRGGRKRGR